MMPNRQQNPTRRARFFLAWMAMAAVLLSASARAGEVQDVEGQPLAAQVKRLVEALRFWGQPLPPTVSKPLDAAIEAKDGAAIQRLLDPLALVHIHINPEVRVRVQRGEGDSTIQQAGFTLKLAKVVNESTVTRQLRVGSPQAGKAYGGAALNSLSRQQQTELNRDARTDAINPNKPLSDDELKAELKRLGSAKSQTPFLDVSLIQAPPLTRNLSGLEVEYVLLALSSSEAGKREATLQFDVGAGTQDIGFRGETPVLFDVLPATSVSLRIRDHDGRPTTARLEIRDTQGRVFPSQAKRVAPDFFFQPQIYRHDGESVLLPPGKFTCFASRGPEYLVRGYKFEVPRPSSDKASSDKASSDKANSVKAKTRWDIDLKRWIHPQEHGFYSGDHHIHGAGCAHYTSPTLGVTPADMFRQVKGEGLNVGCVLTWGPCFEFQRQYFSPKASVVSEPLTVLKYDLEISGFGSAALGHVCLLNLTDQTYPGSQGTKTDAWPSWTVPVMQWCKEQGGVTGYPHSAMRVNPTAAAERFLQHDSDGNKSLSLVELNGVLLPRRFDQLDRDRNGNVSQSELRQGLAEAADQLPNLAVPEMNGAGAMEIFVSVPAGVCDFISAMDTERIQELNTWYHLMNCGFPVKLSGETDFPCMSSRRVGQGRVYVRMGDVDHLDFKQWCDGIAKGESYVSDGYAHALEFQVEGVRPGAKSVSLKKPGAVHVETTVQFAMETPEGVAYGTQSPQQGGRAVLGDTRLLHAERSSRTVRGGRRLIELVVNGRVAESKWVEADGRPHALQWDVQVDQSSWIAVRQFPQLHTNPVNVTIGGKPIRASVESVRWCMAATELLWKNRHQRIRANERPAARKAYDAALAEYRRRLAEHE